MFIASFSDKRLDVRDKILDFCAKVLSRADNAGVGLVADGAVEKVGEPRLVVVCGSASVPTSVSSSAIRRVWRQGIKFLVTARWALISVPSLEMERRLMVYRLDCQWAIDHIMQVFDLSNRCPWKRCENFSDPFQLDILNRSCVPRQKVHQTILPTHDRF